MSGSALREKLRRQLAALDDPAFEALASRGLLRRARKDIESAVKIETADESEAGLRVRVGDVEVTLPESGPAQARCSCAASGICQHILAACLWLRDQPDTKAAAPSAEQVPTAEQELLAITPDAMEKWAGRATLRAAFSLAGQADAEIVEDGAVTVSFRFLNASCRFVPESGLDGAIVTGPPKDARRLVLAAVLVFQKSRGRTWQDAEDEAVAALAENSGAPRSREEVLTSAIALICETVNAGLAHATSATGERFATLSVSALAANLPRLSLALRSLGQELRLATARDASADASRTFLAMARTYALCVALDRAGASAPAPLVGWHRTAYSDVGHLELAGVAAWPWETASGYRGLTVLFWDTAARCWNTWTEARPRHIDPGYDARARFSAGGPWAGADSPQQLSRSRFRLLHARRNPSGRLSVSAKTHALVTGPSIPLELSLPVCTDWSRLAEEVARATPMGLAETNPLDLIRVIRPASWQRRFFDTPSQTFQWPLHDENGNSLLLQIRFSVADEPAIRALETFDPASASGTSIVGRVARSPEGLVLHPFALLPQNGGIDHLNFDHLKSAGPLAPARANNEPGDDNDDTEEDIPEEADFHGAPIARLLTGLEDLLATFSEAGGGAFSPARRDELTSFARRASSIGWRLIPKSVALLAESPSPNPQMLLQCRHECLLYRQSIETD